jgi:hypothetical protein
MADLLKALADSTSGPASVHNANEGTAEHSLPSQIAAAKFLASTRARTNQRGAGLSFAKLRPHGAVLPCGCGREGGM